MSGKDEPPRSETPTPDGAGDARAPSLDAIRAKLGALRKTLDQTKEGSKDVDEKASLSPTAPRAASAPATAPPPLPPTPRAAPASAPASDQSPQPSAFGLQPEREPSFLVLPKTEDQRPKTSPSASASAPAPRDTGETRDAAKTDPGFEVPFTLLRPKSSEQPAPSTDPGRSLGTAAAPPPPPPIVDDSSAPADDLVMRSVRRPWIMSLVAMIPVTGFLCFVAYYVGNARLRSERITEAKDAVQATRTAVDASQREFSGLATRLKKTYGASIDARSNRLTKVEWAEWEAIRATERPRGVDEILGVKRIDRFGSAAVGLLFDYHAKVVEFFRGTADAADGLLARRADVEKAISDPGATATGAQTYAVVARPPPGESALGVGDVVIVRRTLPRASPPVGGKDEGAKVEVVKLSGSHDKPLVLAQDDLVVLSRNDVIRRGSELLREFAEQVRRLFKLAADIDVIHRPLVQELERLAR